LIQNHIRNKITATNKVNISTIEKLKQAIIDVEEARAKEDVVAYNNVGLYYSALAAEVFKSLGLIKAINDRRTILLKQGINASPYDDAFWSDTDMILTLVEFINESKCEV
jgi:hypothetical protein